MPAALHLFYSPFTIRGTPGPEVLGAETWVRIRPRLFHQGLDCGRQFEHGIVKRIVTNRLIGEGPALIAGARGIFCCKQRSTEALLVLKQGDGDRLRRIVWLEAVANK